MYHTPLIGTIVAGLVMAFMMGAIAQKLRVPPIAGYLLAGIIVGPFTPGVVVNTALARELAEIGVILLMFGVGLHFSLRDLLSVRWIALPGALAQIAVATLMGMALGWTLGWPPLAGFVFGLSLSVASTVVLLRALQARDLIDTERGRIAVGWLIVEDLAMVLALVLLPVIAMATTATGADGASVGAAIAGPIASTVFTVAGFIALMLLVGRRLIPWLLHWVVHTGSRELFRLAVLAVALGVAFGAAFVFQVSFALGAFFAGMILGETQLSRRAAEETLPLRDAFAVLFFVSVGMLFDPDVLLEQPGVLLATVLIIVIGKSLAAYAIVRIFGHPSETALVISASLAQIGEFSFILAGLGTGLGILPPEGRDLILAGAILSILANPFVFALVSRRGRPAADATGEASETASEEDGPVPDGTAPRGHVVLIGYGRVGRLVAERLSRARLPLVVVEAERDVAQRAAAEGFEVIAGDATQPAMLDKAAIAEAATLLIAISEGFEGGAIAQRARTANPRLRIIARAHSDAEVAHLERLGVKEVVMGEREIAIRMGGLAVTPARNEEPDHAT